MKAYNKPFCGTVLNAHLEEKINLAVMNNVNAEKIWARPNGQDGLLTGLVTLGKWQKSWGIRW